MNSSHAAILFGRRRVKNPVEKTLDIAGVGYLRANTTHMFYPNYADRSASNRHYYYDGTTNAWTAPTEYASGVQWTRKSGVWVKHAANELPANGKVHIGDTWRQASLSGFSSSGSMVVALRMPYDSTGITQTHVALNKNDTNAHFVVVHTSGGTLYASLYCGEAWQADISLGTYTAGDELIVAVSWTAAGVWAAINGVEKTGQARTIALDVNQLNIGSLQTGSARGSTEHPLTLLFAGYCLTQAERAAITLMPGLFAAKDWDTLAAAGDALQTAYDALAASASASSRKVLMLAAGTHTLGATLNFTDDYVDVIGNTKAMDAIITYTNTVLNQSCADMHLRNLSVEGSAAAGKLELKISTTGDDAQSDSIYDKLTFTTSPYATSCQATGTTAINLSGTWTNITAVGALFSVPYGKIIQSFNANTVTGGAYSVQTPERDDSSGTPSIDFDGTIENFTFGDNSICACTGLGGNIGPHAVIKNGTVGDFSIALGSSIASGAVIQNVVAGQGCYAGNAGGSATYAAATDAGDATLLTISGWPTVPPDVTALRNNLVGATLQEIGGAYRLRKITAIVDAAAKQVRIDSALEVGTAYDVKLWLEGKIKSGVDISDCTYNESYTYAALGDCMKYGEMSAAIARVKIRNATTDAAGKMLGFAQSTNQSPCTGTYEDCHTTGAVKLDGLSYYTVRPIDNGQTFTMADATGNVNPLYLPSSCAVGTAFTFVNAGGFALTLNGNGHNIDGAATKAIAGTKLCTWNGTQWVTS